MLHGISDRRPAWLKQANREMFQRVLARESYEEFQRKWVRVPGGYPSELTVVLSDVRNVAFLRGAPKFSDTKLMKLCVQLGRPLHEVENVEAGARALDAAERYTQVTGTRPSADMLLAFEAMWVAGEFSTAYGFMSALRKSTHRP